MLHKFLQNNSNTGHRSNKVTVGNFTISLNTTKHTTVTSEEQTFHIPLEKGGNHRKNSGTTKKRRKNIKRRSHTNKCKH